MSLREHLPHPHHHAEEAADAESQSDPSEPFPGYSRMSVHDLQITMHTRTQAELAAIEEYERGHANRKEIFDKLHYMRGPQPWQGYDEMPEEETLARLDNADDEMVTRVRDYEHKFFRRPRVVDKAMRLHHEAIEAAEPVEVPQYRPGGAHD